MRYATRNAEPVLEVDRALAAFATGFEFIQHVISDALKIQARKGKFEDDAVRYLHYLSRKEPFTETVWDSCCLCIETMMESAN